jgi:xylulokinase
MEGVAYSLCKALDIFKELQVPVKTVLCSGGGARSPLWRQILADAFDNPVQWQRGEEHSAIGAAIVGALATGRSVTSAATKDESSSDTALPRSERVAIYRKQRAIYKRIHPQLAGIFADLS